MSIACPSENEILAFLGGKLPEARASALHAHVDGCPSCRILLAAIARTAASGAPSSTADGPPRPAARVLAEGAVAGRYRIVRPVGIGASGIVYLADDPELGRRVAIKALRDDAEQGARSAVRARREAQAMAKLSHPNVLPVFDVGELADGGGLFLAMEYVEGGTLGRVVREGRWGWRKIVDAYVLAGRGLAAAHSVGLVHRDFKPENVLVGADGRVRVTDFGLALSRVDCAPFANDAQLRGADHRPLQGTPAYMAPEQLRGEDATPSSDMFSFCVALYQGLYGELPFGGETAREYARAVLAGAVRPSPHGTTVPAWLRHVLLRGLRGTPQERYPSMDALLGALADYPRRLRRLAWAIALAAAVLSASLLIMHVRRAADRSAGCDLPPERALGGVWDDGVRARVEAALRGASRTRTTTVAQTTVSRLDAYASGWNKTYAATCAITPSDTSSRDKQNAALACLHDTRTDLGALAEVLSTADREPVTDPIGAVSTLRAPETCSSPRALPHLPHAARSEAVRRKVAALRGDLAAVRALDATGRYKDALPRAALLVEQARGAGDPELEAEALAWLGDLQDRTGRVAAAIETLGEALKKAQIAPSPTTIAQIGNAMAWIEALERGHYAQALQWCEMAAGAAEAAGGDAAIEARTELHFGLIRLQLAEYDRAAAHLDRSLALWTKVGGPETVNTCNVRIDQGNVEEARERYDIALARYRDCTKMADRDSESMRAALSISLVDEASALVKLGRPEDAIRALERAFVLIDESAGLEGYDASFAYLTLGRALRRQGDDLAAFAFADKALDLRTKAYGPEHPDVGVALADVALIDAELGHGSEAVEQAERALAMRVRLLPAGHPGIAEARIDLAEVLLLARRPADAERVARAGIEALEGRSDSQLRLARALVLLAGGLMARGVMQQAVAPLTRAVHIYETVEGDPRHLEAARASLDRAKGHSRSSVALLPSPDGARR